MALSSPSTGVLIGSSDDRISMTPGTDVVGAAREGVDSGALDSSPVSQAATAVATASAPHPTLRR